MKKTLLFIGLLSFGVSNAQLLINDDYNALTVGNITTDVTGTTAGQGGYYTFGGAAADYQIVAEGGTQGNVIQMSGTATATVNKFLFKDVATSWATRTSGNNIVDVEFDIHTGVATTSKNTARVYLYNSDGSTVLAGLNLNLETKIITGISYYDPNNGGTNPVGTYSFNLGASNAAVTLTANSWVRLGLSYNTVTRQVIWKGPGFYVGVTGAVPATGTTNPGEVDYLHIAGTSNTVAASSKFDNLTLKAVAVESLLGTDDFTTLTTNEISVYPNPATDIININSSLNSFNSVSVVDLNGRVVKSMNFNTVTEAQINISDLANGVYIMNITSENGAFSKKIIKE